MGCTHDAFWKPHGGMDPQGLQPGKFIGNVNFIHYEDWDNKSTVSDVNLMTIHFFLNCCLKYYLRHLSSNK